MKTRKAERGFSLIELLVVIGIIGVAMVYGVFSSQSRTNKYQNLRGEAKALLTLFRGAAAQSWGGYHVVAQMSTSSVHFFIDKDADGIYTGGDETIRTYTPPAGEALISAIQGGGKLEFLPRGTSRYDYVLTSTTAPDYTAADGVFLQLTTDPSVSTSDIPGWYSINLNSRTGVVELIKGYQPLS